MHITEKMKKRIMIAQTRGKGKKRGTRIRKREKGGVIGKRKGKGEGGETGKGGGRGKKVEGMG